MQYQDTSKEVAKIMHTFNIMSNEVPIVAYFVTFFLFVMVQLIPWRWLDRKPFNCEVCFSFWVSLIGMFVLFSIDFFFINFFVTFVSLKIVSDGKGSI